MKTIHDPKELDFRNEYDSQLNVFNEGTPFTGMFKTTHEEITYEKGNAVHVIEYYENGEKRLEEFLKDGAQLKSYSWYADGSVKMDLEFDHQYYLEDGTVLTTGFTFYPNGAVETKCENGIRLEYSKDGILVGESKWVPGEKYHKEYYLNGSLKYLRLPSIKKSFHFTNTYVLVIEVDQSYKRSNIYYDEIRIKSHLRELFFSEGAAYGFSKSGDNLRIQRLVAWLTQKVKDESPQDYFNYNLELCFSQEEQQVQNAFTRLISKFDINHINDFSIPKITNIDQEEVSNLLERLKLELEKKIKPKGEV